MAAKATVIKYASLLLLPLLALACQTPEPTALPVPVVDAANTEAREDSLALAAAYAGQWKIKTAVSAQVETASARAQKLEDAADDPAIWRHPVDPARSLIFGSNKTGGLAVYNLRGEEVGYYPIGKVNNVDILTDVPLGDTTVTLLGCSNRSDQSIDLFRIDPETGELTDVAANALQTDTAEIDDIYGFCLGRNKESNDVYVIINGKNGRMQQFRLVEEAGKFALEMVRDLTFPSQTEGMVADEELGWLYVGEEAAGIWKLPLVPSNDEARPQVQRKLDGAMVGHNPAIVADVEGITLARTGPGTGYLVASVQGNFSYAVFDRAGDNAYLGSFKIIDGPTVDGVEETDGLEIMTGAFGPEFPNGLLVAQDGFNFTADTLQPQNFKLVDWGMVLEALAAARDTATAESRK